MNEVVIVSACRTAIGKFLGVFKDVPAKELAVTVGKEAIKRAGFPLTQLMKLLWDRSTSTCRSHFRPVLSDWNADFHMKAIPV
jgi:hypothetical protein